MNPARNKAAQQDRYYIVTDHALARFRERLPEIRNLSYTHDDAAKIALGTAIVHARSKPGMTEDIIDDGKPSVLIDLRDTYEDLVALVREGAPRNSAMKEWVVITVLTREQVENNKSNPGWRWEHAGRPGKGMVNLKDQLTGVIAASAASIQAASPEPVAESKLVEKVGPSVPVEMFLVQWNDTEAHTNTFVSKDAVTAFANKLLDRGIETENIQVFRAEWVPLKAKVKVEF